MRHTKCKGYETDCPSMGKDYGCDYGTDLTCDECKYLLDPDGKPMGRKDPAAKCNRRM
jgi:hypothetical protein